MKGSQTVEMYTSYNKTK